MFHPCTLPPVPRHDPAPRISLMDEAEQISRELAIPVNNALAYIRNPYDINPYEGKV